jgi:hypothetical protein
MNKQSLLIAILLLLTFNLSNLFVPVDAQEQPVFKPQQLTLTPIGKGSYTKLFDVEGLSGPYFSENWQYAELADSKILRVHWRDGSATDTYELSDHDPTKNFGSIYSVEIAIKYLSNGYSEGLAGAIYINDTLYNTEKLVITKMTEGSTYSRTITKNPITAKPWTWKDIDNLEAGATLFTGSLSSGPDFDQVYVIVNYGMDITVFTNPPDCNVTLNNTTVNSGLNGATFTGLTSFTAYNVTVSKQYFYPKTEAISINDTDVERNISLIPSHYRLVVITNPADCTIFIDSVEKTSDMVPENTSHKITVSKDFFYYTKEETVVVRDQDTTVQIALVPSPIPYVLFVICVLIFCIVTYLYFKRKKKLEIQRKIREEQKIQEEKLREEQKRKEEDDFRKNHPEEWQKREEERKKEEEERKRIREVERKRRAEETDRIKLIRQREERERNEKRKLINAIESFEPFKTYTDEKSFQIDLARWLHKEFPSIKIEESTGSTRPDIVVDDVAIEVKGPTGTVDLETIADKCLRYRKYYKKMIVVLFDVHVNDERYNDWLEGMKENFPDVIVIKK